MLKSASKSIFFNLLRPIPFQFMFLPDLVTSLYGKKAKEFYDENKINIVPKEGNPPNCPELRPIEKYWAHMKSYLKGTKSRTFNLKDFRRKWRYQSKLLSKGFVQSLMNSLRSQNLRSEFFGAENNLTSFVLLCLSL